MAVTKIWAVKDDFKRICDYAINPEKTEMSDDLWAVLHYSSNRKKTRYDETLAFVSGVHCSDKHPYEDMMAVKKHFRKMGGNLAYHAYQSFKPGEVTPQECHEIGVQLARQLWGKRFQVLVCTHMDKHHLHNHFVINSVSYVDGKKFDCSERTYFQMRQVSDELCRRHDLSVIKHTKGHTPRTIYFAENRGEPTRYNLMREAIDKAAAMSKTMEQFKVALLKLGYVYDDNPNHKYPTIRSVHSKKATRIFHLGVEYEPEKLRKRMSWNRSSVRSQWYDFMYPKAPRTKRKVYRFKGSWKSVKRAFSIHVLFYVFGCMLGVYPKNNPSRRRQPQSPELKQALRFLDRFTEQVRLIGKYDLKTEDDVAAFIVATERQIDELCRLRRSLYDQVSRAKTDEQKANLREQYTGLTEQITALRKDLRTTRRIVDDIPKIKDGIVAERELRSLQREIEQTQRNKSMRKERTYER